MKPYSNPHYYFLTWLIILLCLSSDYLWSQPSHFRFKTYGFEEGLSQSVIQKILQDKNGFIWIATQDGLSRFDGYRFKTVKKGLSENELPWGNVRDLTEDSSTHCLWIATSARGICSMDLLTGKITKFPVLGDSLLSNAVCNALCLTENFAWIATSTGITVLDKSTKSVIRHLQLPEGVAGIISANEKEVWAFSPSAFLYKLDNRTAEIKAQLPYADLFKKNKTLFWKVFCYGETVYICTRNGLYKTSGRAGVKPVVVNKVNLLTDRNTDLTDEYVYSFYTDRSRNEWIGIDQVGLLVKRPGEKKYTVYSKETGNKYSLPDNFIRQTLEDNSSGIWFASEKGLTRIIPQPDFFETIGEEVDYPDNRLSRLFALATTNDSIILTGGLGLLHLYNRYTAQVTEIKNHTGIDPQRFYFIFPFLPGKFLAGCKEGLRVLEQKRNVYILRNPEEYPELSAAAGYRLTAIATVSDSVILFGGIEGAGLFIWNIKEHRLERFTGNNTGTRSLINNNVNRILLSKNGFAWIATDGGLSAFDLSKRSFTNYSFQDFIPEKHIINDLAEINNELWMAFYQEGLVKWNLTTGARQIFSTADGLLSNAIYNFRPDGKENLWLSTNQGLSVFRIRQSKFINYTINDGIQDNEFNRFCVFESPGKIYFGGISGFTVIDKNKIRFDKSFPAIIPAEIEYLDNNEFIGLPFGTTSVNLNHLQNNIRLFLASLDFSSSHKLLFAYKLDGINENWMVSQESPDVNYTNLPPGHYVFKVKAVNPEFSGEPVITELPIFIRPAWYQTPLFKILTGLALAGILFLLFRQYYISRLRKQKLEYEKILAVQQERQRISSEIHDDIGAGLSGIRLLTELTRKKIETDEVQNEVDKIYLSVSELSGKMREVIWSLNTDNDTIENLVHYIRRQARHLFENSSIRLMVSLPDTLPAKFLPGEKRRNIFLATKEALHNSLKHSEATHVRLDIRYENTELNITISDDGKGMNNHTKYGGEGLTNMRRRMEKVNGNMLIENKTGTTVRFNIPII